MRFNVRMRSRIASIGYLWEVSAVRHSAGTEWCSCITVQRPLIFFKPTVRRNSNWCENFAKLPAREEIRQPHHQPSRLLDGRKKCVNCVHKNLFVIVAQSGNRLDAILRTTLTFPLQNMIPPGDGFQPMRKPQPDGARPIPTRHPGSARQ